MRGGQERYGVVPRKVKNKKTKREKIDDRKLRIKTKRQTKRQKTPQERKG